MESMEIEGTRRESTANGRIYSFIYVHMEQQGEGLGLISHYQQRGRAEKTGRCWDACSGMQMVLPETKQCRSAREECEKLVINEHV